MKNFAFVVKSIFYLFMTGLWLLLARQLETPGWAVLSTLAIIAALFFEMHEIKRELARDLTRIKCELIGHGYAEFKKKYDDAARCPRCKDVIRTRAPGETDVFGMQLAEDTLHQRICRVEEALGIKE